MAANGFVSVWTNSGSGGRQVGWMLAHHRDGLLSSSFWQTDWATGDQVSKHSVCWWFVAWDAAQLQMLRMLVSPEAYNFSSFDSKSLLCARASKLKQQICKLIYTYTHNVGVYTYHIHIIYMFAVVNFDALAQASDSRIERRQDVFHCWMQDWNPGSLEPNLRQTEFPLTNRLSYRGSS